MFWNVLTYRGKCALILSRDQSAFEIIPANLHHVIFLSIYMYGCSIEKSVTNECDDERRELNVDLVWSVRRIL